MLVANWLTGSGLGLETEIGRYPAGTPLTLTNTWDKANHQFISVAELRAGLLPGGSREPPDGLDWDLWLGPAPKVPFNANRFGVVPDRWSTFRYFFLRLRERLAGRLGRPLVDIVQWAMEVPGPQVVTCTGQKNVIKDNVDTPDTLVATFEYPGFVCTYENRQANGNSMFGKGYGIEFHGSEATMFLDAPGSRCSRRRAKSGKDEDRRQEPEGGRSLGVDEDGAV